MGSSTTATLAYGYDLGGPEEWQVRQVCQYGGLTGLDWYDPDIHHDFPGSVKTRLLDRIAGFTEQWAPGHDDYFDRAHAAEARVGVEIVTHGSHDIPFYALTAHQITTQRGQVTPLEQVADDLAEAAANERLAAALVALGLTPWQKAPGWLLLAYGDR